MVATAANRTAAALFNPSSPPESASSTAASTFYYFYLPQCIFDAAKRARSSIRRACDGLLTKSSDLTDLGADPRPPGRNSRTNKERQRRRPFLIR